MLQALEKELTGHSPLEQARRWRVRVGFSAGGDLDTTEMFQQAIQRKVAYIPGGVFSVEGSTRNALRLNFSNVKPEAIREGIRRLAEVIRAAVDPSGTA